jgi:hypothetical protein
MFGIGREDLNIRGRTGYFDIFYPILTMENGMACGLRVGGIANDQSTAVFFTIERPIDETGVARPRTGSP